MKKEQKLEQQQNSDSDADNSQVSPTCPKPNVVRSFLVLTYAGIYVDGKMLSKGIYEALTPDLYPKKTTIQHIANAAGFIPDLPDTYLENLRKCTLSEVVLIGNECLPESCYKELRTHILKMESDMRSGNYNAVIRNFPALLQKLDVMRSLSQ